MNKTTKELRALLRERGLRVGGVKAALVARLAADEKESAELPPRALARAYTIDTTPGTWVPPGARSWIVSLRPWSAPASLVPVFVAGSVVHRELGVDLLSGRFALCAAGVLSLHFAANLTNTYYDYVRMVDTKEYADDRALVDSHLAPRTVLGLAGVCFVAAAASAAGIAAVAGAAVVPVAALAIALGFLYTGGPFGLSLKKLGLGDVTIFAMFGPLLMLGVCVALTAAGGAEAAGAEAARVEAARNVVLLYSFPMGMLAMAILHANNARDMAADAGAGIATVAQLLGQRGSFVLYALQLLAAYATTLYLLHRDYPNEPWRLVPVLCAAPWALYLLRRFRFDDGRAEAAAAATGAPLPRISPSTRLDGLLAELPQRTAQHNLFFTSLLLLTLATPQLCARALLGILFYLGGFNNILMWRNSCDLCREKLANVAPLLGRGRALAPLVPVAFACTFFVSFSSLHPSICLLIYSFVCSFLFARPVCSRHYDPTRRVGVLHLRLAGARRGAGPPRVARPRYPVRARHFYLPLHFTRIMLTI